MNKINSNPIRITISSNGYFSRLLYAFTDFFMLNVSFFIVHCIKRGTLNISSDYLRLLFLFYLIWIVVSVMTKKYQIKTQNFVWVLFMLAKSILLMLYGISVLIVFFGLTLFSRVHIFGTFLLFFVLEIAFFALIYAGSEKEFSFIQSKIHDTLFHNLKTSVFLLVCNFVLLNISFFALNFLIRGSLVLKSDYEKILLLIYGLWLVSAIVTKKFNIQNFRNFYFAIGAGAKSIIFMALSLSMLIFAFRMFYFSRLQIFGTLIIFGILEAVLVYFYFVIRFGGDLGEDIESTDQIHDFLEQRELSVDGDQQKLSPVPTNSFMKMLSEKYLKSLPGIFEFVDNSLDLSNIDSYETALVSSPEFFNIQIIKDESIRLLINLSKINDVRWINRYFLEVYKRLYNGAYFICCADTIVTHKKRFFRKYPRYFAHLLYFFHFLYYRVFPKLPKLRKIYFSLTKGKNRMISRAEVLGRLSFCGFRILSEKEIGDKLFIIAQKAKTPSLDQNPSYGPIIKLRRIGVNGQPIEVYKFRTMYPYSEYLQEYIYEHQRLEDGGKIRRDFRVTDWGKFMRRYWLDEMPMIYNWIKGDIKLFGVRPLSKHYLNLYDKKVREIRSRVKPGLIPPYYADLPRKFEEINESEKQYLLAYLEHPFKTQIYYFFRVLNSIILRGARSG